MTSALRALLLALVVHVSIIAPVNASTRTAAVGNQDQPSFGIWLPLMLVFALALMCLPNMLPASLRRWRR